MFVKYLSPAASFPDQDKQVLSQLIRQEGILSRSLIESLLGSVQESPRFTVQQSELPRYIGQQLTDPYASILPVPNIPISPNVPLNNPDCAINIPSSVINIPNPTIGIPNPITSIPNPAISISNPSINPHPTLINDCPPSVCKNLANAIQLMVVSDLLKNREAGDEIALKLATPFLSDFSAPLVVKSPVRSSANLGANLVKTISPSRSLLVSNAPRMVFSVTPNVTPNIPPNLTPNPLTSLSSGGQIERGLLTKMLKLLGGAL